MLLIDIPAAFEVYVRRAYKAYTLMSIDYEEGDTLDDGEVPTAVTWRFNLGQSHSPPDTPHISKGFVQMSRILLLRINFFIACLLVERLQLVT